MKTIHKSKIKRILVVSLSNIGDVILTFPVIDILKSDFPNAKLDVIVGPKAKELLKENPNIDKVHIFDKHQPFLKMARWVLNLRKYKFDLVVDLRNTAIPFALSPRYRTPLFVKRWKSKHAKVEHLHRLKLAYPYRKQSLNRYAMHVSQKDKQEMDFLIKHEIGKDPFILVSPGAADSKKQWTESGFASVCDQLMDEYQIKIVFIGDKNDRRMAQAINKKMANDAVNLSGQVTLTQLAYLLEQTQLLISNDSAPMHLASYLNIPVLAIFGPTDPRRYGPWGKICCVVQRKGKCPACKNKNTSHKHECMQQVQSKDVLDAIQFKGEGVVFKNQR